MNPKVVDTKCIHLRAKSRCCCRARHGLLERRAHQEKLRQKSTVRHASTGALKVSAVDAIATVVVVEDGIVEGATEAEEDAEIVIVVIANRAAVSPRRLCHRITRRCCFPANRYQNIAVHR
jgi:hypothetical protein